MRTSQGITIELMSNKRREDEANVHFASTPVTPLGQFQGNLLGECLECLEKFSSRVNAQV